MLLVVCISGKKYIKSVDTLDEFVITDIVSKLIHKDDISHNVEGTELTIDEEYDIYETEFVDDPGDSEDEPIGCFYVTNNTLLFEGGVVHSEF